MLGVTEDDIFPAPSRIESAARCTVPRSQETDLVAQIVNANTPVILHAAGWCGEIRLIAAHKDFICRKTR